MKLRLSISLPTSLHETNPLHKISHSLIRPDLYHELCSACPPFYAIKKHWLPTPREVRPETFSFLKRSIMLARPFRDRLDNGVPCLGTLFLAPFLWRLSLHPPGIETVSSDFALSAHARLWLVAFAICREGLRIPRLLQPLPGYNLLLPYFSHDKLMQLRKLPR